MTPRVPKAFDVTAALLPAAAALALCVLLGRLLGLPHLFPLAMLVTNTTYTHGLFRACGLAIFPRPLLFSAIAVGMTSISVGLAHIFAGAPL